MTANAVGTGVAIAGTTASDPSTPAAPLLFKRDILKRASKRLREKCNARVQTTD